MLPSRFLVILFIILPFLSFSQDNQFTIIAGDTIELRLDSTIVGTLQWQEREDPFAKWNDIPNATTNAFQIVCQFSNEKIKNYRAKIVHPTTKCNSYTNEMKFKVINGISNVNIGDFVAGGLIYYKNNEFGLIASTISLLQTSWGCQDIEINGADSMGLGYGDKNTKDIINQCKDQNIAAYMADTFTLNGYSDWFLPSFDELKLMVDTLMNKGIGFNTDFYYWSSSENSSKYAYSYVHSTGLAIKISKNDKFRKVHPIRKINLKTANFYSHSFKLIPNEENDEIKTLPVQGKPTNVFVFHTGAGLETDNYLWNFGYGKVLSGSGKGPYEIGYNFGGYNRITAKNRSSTCPTDTAESSYFRVKLFEDIKANLPPSHLGTYDWGDYNNDGLLDALVTGGQSIEIFKNVGNDTFNKVPVQFPKITLSGCDWGDFNNDELLDFAVCGLSDTLCITEVYQNLGNDVFKKLDIHLPGVKNGFVKWFDQNNDGFIELIVSGEDKDSLPITKVFSEFTNKEPITFDSKIINLKNSNGSFGDFNNDGFSDLMITGNDGTNRRTLLYRNEKGQFKLMPSKFTDIEYGSVEWGDYDNDGLLDFAMTGAKDSILIEYFNNGRGLKVSFSKAVYTGVYQQYSIDSFKQTVFFDKIDNCALSNVDWGDYDSDGFSDLLLTGVPRLSYESHGIGGGKVKITYPSRPVILRNYQNHSFSNIFADIPSFLDLQSSGSVINSISHSFACSFAQFGDYNNDGNLDFIREGTGVEGSAIYKNLSQAKNTPPSSPSGLLAKLECNSAQFNWRPAIDDHTPSQSLIYEIYIGTSPGKCDILSRKNINKIQDTFYVISQLNPGTYYWSVKSVDQSTTASGFATEQSFTIIGKPSKPVITQTGNALLSSSSTGNQWYNSKGLIANASSQTYLPMVNDIYFCIVTQNGCISDTSNRIHYILNSTNDSDNNSMFEIFPNPTKDILNISCNKSNKPFEIKISNKQGQQYYFNKAFGNLQIQVAHFPSGDYQIEISSNMKYYYKSFLKI